MNAVQKLRSLVDEIKGSPDPFKKVDAWALAERLLGRMPGVDQAELKRVAAEKDVAGLDTIVHAIEHPEERKKAEPGAAAGGAGDAGGAAREISEEEMRHAMKAFRKRLKLARLSDESRITGRLLTKGQSSQIDAIIPPTDIPTEVWQALVQRGELEYTGEGFYALPGDTKRT